MGRDGSATRQLLLDAALDRFAENGINGASMKEIVQAANQRNVSALQYHFGSREGLIEAVMMRHTPGLRDRRRELIALAKEAGDLRSASVAFVVPFGELLAGEWRERAFLQVVADLFADPYRTLPSTTALTGDTAMVVVSGLLSRTLAPMPRALRKRRIRIGNMLVVHALSDQARALNSKLALDSPERARGFVSNLVDMHVAALSAPCTAETASLMGLTGGDAEHAPRRRVARGSVGNPIDRRRPAL